MKRTVLFVLAIVIGVASGLPAASPDRSQAQAKASEVLKQARAALGGEAKLSAVQSLTIVGKMRRVMTKEMQVSGDLEISVQLPDKYLRSEITAIGPSTATRLEGFNGEQSLDDMKSTGGAVFIRMSKAEGPGAETVQLKRKQADLARLLIAWLLASPPFVPVEFAYAGEAESPDGRADVLDVKGPDNFAVRLFVDASSHLPLMMTYLSPEMRVVTMVNRAPAGVKPEDLEKAKEKALAEAKQRAEATSGEAPKMVETTVYFSDYRKVDGIQFPHQVTRAVAGETVEEWTVQKFSVNPVIKPGTFEKR
jgi:hypothetical protein